MVIIILITPANVIISFNNAVNSAVAPRLTVAPLRPHQPPGTVSPLPVATDGG